MDMRRAMDCFARGTRMFLVALLALAAAGSASAGSRAERLRAKLDSRDRDYAGDPDGSWGWALEQGATMIQTDRPAELIKYLEKKGRRNLR